MINTGYNGQQDLLLQEQKTILPRLNLLLFDLKDS